MEQTRQNIFVFLFHKKIFTKGPIYRRVMTRAVFVCLLKVNVWEFLLCRLCQSSSQFTNSHKSKGFLWSFTVALPIRKFVLNSCLLFSFVHQTLTSFKKEEASNQFGQQVSMVAHDVWSKIARARGTLCLYLQDALRYTTI